MKTMLLILVIVSLLWVTERYYVSPAPAQHRPVITESEKRWVKDRMAYHGIVSCMRDEKGYYFTRKGRRCKL